MEIPSIAPPVGLVKAVHRGRHHLLRLHQWLAPAQAAMTELVVGAWLAQAIAVAADLRIADALADGPLGLDELADRVGANPDALRRLLRALVSRGIFRRRSDGRYDLTPLAATLRWEAPDSVAAFARFVGSAQSASIGATASMRSEPVGRSFPSTRRGGLRLDRESARIERGLQPGHDESLGDGRRRGDRRLRLRPLSHHRGYCRRARPAAGRHPGGDPNRDRRLFDLPHVVAGAEPLLSKHRVAERVRIVEGSFFDAVPEGGDLYVLKNIIHDWPDDKAQQILKTLRAATRTGATLLLVECVIPPHDRDSLAKWTDLEMLVVNTGRERTGDEYQNLLQQAGFHMTRIVSTASPFSIVEATAA